MTQAWRHVYPCLAVSLACMPTELTPGPVMNGITYDRHTSFYLAVSVACRQTELT